MNEDVFKRMQEDAKRCNARLRKVIGHNSSFENRERAKLSAAKGGRASRKYKASQRSGEGEMNDDRVPTMQP